LLTIQTHFKLKLSRNSFSLKISKFGKNWLFSSGKKWAWRDICIKPVKPVFWSKNTVGYLYSFWVLFVLYWMQLNNKTTYWRLKSEPVIGWKFSAVFIGLLPFKTEIQSFSSKSGQKCNLLYRLKDKGKLYLTLETMLSKRQGKTRIKTCFHWSSSLRYFTCFVDFWNLRKLHKDATLILFV